MADQNEIDLTTLTVQLLSAYVSNNTVESADLAGLIQSTRAALAPVPVEEAEPAPAYTPAVSVRKSLASPDAIISMIDGKPYRTLKRHLSGHGLTPADYIARYNLPKDYPLVAPTYSEKRREVAKRLGLGRKPAAPAAAPEPEAPPAPASKAKRAAKPAAVEAPAPTAPAKRGRKPSAPASPTAAEKPRRGRKPAAS